MRSKSKYLTQSSFILNPFLILSDKNISNLLWFLIKKNTFEVIIFKNQIILDSERFTTKLKIYSLYLMCKENNNLSNYISKYLWL